MKLMTRKREAHEKQVAPKALPQNRLGLPRNSVDAVTMSSPTFTTIGRH